MTKYAKWIVTTAVVLGFGYLWLGADDQHAPEMEKKVLYWVAPMDPNYKSDTPGKSPMGMDLVPVYEDGDMGEGPAVTINPAVVQNLGIRSANVERGNLQRTIHTVGYVERNDDATTHVHVRVNGWVEKLFIKSVGDVVTKGAPLFEIYSPELATAQEEYLQALSIGQTVLKRASFKRLQIMGMKDADIASLEKRGKAQDRVTIYAPQKGYVDALNIGEGMFVKPGTTIAVLVDDTRAWVLADIFEEQSGWLKVGDKAAMWMTAYPERRWEGEIGYIYPTVDATTRALKVRLVFANEGRVLKGNMYTNLTLYGASKDHVLSVPKEAVIRKQDTARVVLDLGEGRFRPAEVTTGMESEGRIEITSGLSEGERVVISGQFLIDSEASTDASLLRLTSEVARASEVEEKVQAHEQHEDETASVMGVVTSLMPASNMITIEHEPIPGWNWAAMTMDFIARADVDISYLQAGDTVHFILERSGDGEILITHIMLVERPDHGGMNHD